MSGRGARKDNSYADYEDPPKGIRGRGGKHPVHLKGKNIGMFYAQKGKQRKEEHDKKTRAVIRLSPVKQFKVASLLGTVTPVAPTSQTIATATDSPAVPYGHIGESRFKQEFLQTYQGNMDVTLSSTVETVFEARLVPDPALDAKFTQEWSENRSCERYRELAVFRKQLPALKMREEILKVISENQVVVISGETGCGKTTQVTQFILDDALERNLASGVRIVCTQPRRISAISVAERVADERGQKCGLSVGYQIRLERELPRERASILYCTTGILLQWLQSDPYLQKVSHVILDEIHERDILSDFLITLLKDVLPKRPAIKVVLMSATLNADLFSVYFNNCPTLNIPGFTFPVDEYYLEDVLDLTGYRVRVRNKGGKGAREDRIYAEMIGTYIRELDRLRKYSSHTRNSLRMPECEILDLRLIFELIWHICTCEGPGAILVFLPGWDQIAKLNQMLRDDRSFNPNRYVIIPLHSLMPSANQRKVFERPANGVRKIVLATNIAETSITIDDVVFVIDCGRLKQSNFDQNRNLATLMPEWMSLANARQRRGRAGRVQPGKCYHLYSRVREANFLEFPVPEMVRKRLEEVILQIKILKLGKAQPFLEKVLQPPPKQTVKISVQLLQTLGALDTDEHLTPLGFHLAGMPTDPQTGRMLIMAAIFSCLDPLLTVAASLSFKDPFVVPLGQEDKVNQRKRILANNTRSDHMLLIRVMELWEEAEQKGQGRDFCWKNYVSSNTLFMLRDMKKQFCRELFEKQFLSSPDPKELKSNYNSKNEDLIQALISSALYPNVVRIRKETRISNKALKKDKRGKSMTSSTTKDNGKFETTTVTFTTPEDGRVSIHPKSVNEKETRFTSSWMVYHQKVKSTSIFLYDCSEVSPFVLLFFGQGINLRRERDGTEVVHVDANISFRCDKDTARIVQDLRLRLDQILAHRIAHPGFVDWFTDKSEEKAILGAIVELLSSESGLEDIDSDEEEDQASASHYQKPITAERLKEDGIDKEEQPDGFEESEEDGGGDESDSDSRDSKRRLWGANEDSEDSREEGGEDKYWTPGEGNPNYDNLY